MNRESEGKGRGGPVVRKFVILGLVAFIVVLVGIVIVDLLLPPPGVGPTPTPTPTLDLLEPTPTTTPTRDMTDAFNNIACMGVAFVAQDYVGGSKTWEEFREELGFLYEDTGSGASKGVIDALRNLLDVTTTSDEETVGYTEDYEEAVAQMVDACAAAGY